MSDHRHVVLVTCLALDAAAVRVATALRARDIDSVLLKGAALRLRLGYERPYHDVDLLVAPERFVAAQDVLAELGHQPVTVDVPDHTGADWHERQWRTPDAVPVKIDLHRGFAGVADAERFWVAVSSRAERVDLLGQPVAVPDAACTALLAALHGANPGRSAKPLVDLVRALDVLPATAWRAATEIARDCGATSAFALGLRQVDAGATRARQLGLPHGAPLPQVVAARGGSPAARGLARLDGLPTARSRVRDLCRRTVPSPAAAWRALVRRDLRAVTAPYLARAGRHARHLPGAVRELRAARRLATPPDGGPSRVFLSAGGGRARAGRPGRLPGDVGAVLRVLRRRGVPGLRSALWTARSVRRVRRQVASAGLAAVRLAPPPVTGADRALVCATLRRTGANCLERSLVLQRWHAARGEARTLVIGVTAPSAGFHAHAWLHGDPDDRHDGMVELLRRPPPPEWLSTVPVPARP
ncbi:lasso peptide biosynthesis B2 protein [Micromonospora echinospora]|uniref:lasso peptide biosynthesis B2 protein n=1 Tax=Micromonospora echinospora TaxID=1877 RepID=UPI00366C37FF